VALGAARDELPALSAFGLQAFYPALSRLNYRILIDSSMKDRTANHRSLF